MQGGRTTSTDRTTCFLQPIPGNRDPLESSRGGEIGFEYVWDGVHSTLWQFQPSVYVIPFLM